MSLVVEPSVQSATALKPSMRKILVRLLFPEGYDRSKDCLLGETPRTSQSEGFRHARSLCKSLSCSRAKSGENKRSKFPVQVRNLPSPAPETRTAIDGVAQSCKPFFWPVAASRTSTCTCAGVGVSTPVLAAAVRSSGVSHANTNRLSVKSTKVGQIP